MGYNEIHMVTGTFTQFFTRIVGLVLISIVFIFCLKYILELCIKCCKCYKEESLRREPYPIEFYPRYGDDHSTSSHFPVEASCDDNVLPNSFQRYCSLDSSSTALIPITSNSPIRLEQLALPSVDSTLTPSTFASPPPGYEEPPHYNECV